MIDYNIVSKSRMMDLEIFETPHVVSCGVYEFA